MVVRCGYRNVLPDFPKLKKDLDKVLNAYFRQQVLRLLPGGNQISRHLIYEGSDDAIARGNEEVEATHLHRAGVDMALSREQLLSGNAAALMEQLNKGAQEMARQQFEVMTKTIEESCGAIGNVIDCGGKPFTAGTLLDALRMVEVPFSADGTPQLPTLFVGPDSPAARIQQEAAADPEWQRQFQEIIEHKWVKWRDSEAARILAG